MKKNTVLMLGLAIFLNLPATFSSAATLPEKPPLLRESKELILLLTPNLDAVSGEIQHYQRSETNGSWIAVGKPVQAVVGEHGMALGIDFQPYHWKEPIKKEGDGRTPIGVFTIGPVFGFDKRPANPKLPYLALTEATICVDDKTSKYYNQVIDRSKISNPDWNSGEEMRKIPLYRLGSVINYNTVAGAGSCIFLHHWVKAGKGTAGCVAMNYTDLKPLLMALNSARHPVIALFPLPIYQRLQKKWDLPVLH